MAEKKPYLFQRLAKGLGQPLQPAQGKSLEWLKAQARDLASISGATPQQVMSDKDVISLRGMRRELVGSVMFYFYDAVTPLSQLKYYDQFPLSIVLDVHRNYHLVLSLHYLPPLMRSVLFDKLYTLRNDNTLDERTRLNVSYKILKNSTRFKGFQTCLKRHNWDRIRSQLKVIPVKWWDFALGLPVAQWVGSSQEAVWGDALKKARGG